MANIQRLYPHLVDKIAAGEVIERPASIVKELVENALDAGARFIKISIEEGGKKKIQIIDDGFGMTAEDVALCVERHATSKIKNEADLFSIHSFGFRGEALPSIAAVSHLTIDSKHREGNGVEGARVEVRGAETMLVRAVGCPLGTTVTVENLFFNTPARRKFLKSDTVESGHIQETVLRLALGSPNCGFELSIDGKRKLLAQATEDPLRRLQELLRKEWVNDWVLAEEKNPDLSLKTWLLNPRHTQSNNNDIYVYLNGRYLKDRVLLHAVTQGYYSCLMRGQYPAAVLYLQCNPAQVDVNVHPAKREVRFEKSSMVHDFVAGAIRKGLQKKIYTESSIPFVRGWKGGVGSNRPPPSNQLLSTLKNPISVIPAKAGIQNFQEIMDPDFRRDDVFRKTLSFSSLIPLAQYAQTYILCESPDGELVLIDQHAAHERIGYEQLKKQWEQKKVAMQRLLVPDLWEATPAQISIVEEYQKQFEEAGFEVEVFGEKTISIKAVPVLLMKMDIKKLLTEVVSEFSDMTVSKSIAASLDYVL